MLCHVVLGTASGAASFSLAVVAGVGCLGQAVMKRSWPLVGLMTVHDLLIDAGRLGLAYVSALHPVNALLILLVTFSLSDIKGVCGVFTR